MVEAARHLCGGCRPAACGISCGGPLSSRRGLILSPPNLPGWDEIAVVERVSRQLGIAALLENDANAAALAEWRWGLHRRVEDLVYLTCGTGQGAGIILGGRLHRGQDDLAGEIGHVRLRAHGPVGFGKAGSVEGLTAAKALAELARRRLDEMPSDSRLKGLAPREDRLASHRARRARRRRVRPERGARAGQLPRRGVRHAD
jgi:glucokinase